MNTIEQVFGSTAATNASNKSREELGQEDFMKLMVAQLKNQDPSNPADNTEFLGQIAQFSMVSGIDDLGLSFDSVASNLYATQAMQASQLVGKNVLVDTETASLVEGGKIEGAIYTESPVANARLIIQDLNGTQVSYQDIGSLQEGGAQFSWDGLLEDGSAANPGQYVVSAEGLVNGELVALPVQHFSKVESVSVGRNNSNVQLRLQSGNNVSISQVSEFK